MKNNIIEPVDIPQDMRNAAFDYATSKMNEGFNINSCNQLKKDKFYDHYYLYIISTHGDNQWNAALEEVKEKANKMGDGYVIHEVDIDNLKK